MSDIYLNTGKPYEAGLELQDRENISASSQSLPGDEYNFPVNHLHAMELPRSLNQRHVRMIGVAGTIGVGLFLGSGQAISTAGPAGALIAYILVATVAFATMQSVGEMTVFAPVAGSFSYFAERWVDPAFGFSVGWTYWVFNALAVPCEISAAVVILSYWERVTVAVSAGSSIAFIFAIFISNIVAVRYFGEVESVFSFVKIVLIFVLLIGGIIVNARDKIGFEYWNNPGRWSGAGLSDNPTTDRFLGIVAATMQAAFSFQGMELMVIAAAETRNPRTNIPLAINRVVIRIGILYVLGVLIAGIIVRHDDPALLHNVGNGAQSPFVIAFSKIKGFPDVVNGIMLISALLAANSFLFSGTRVLYGLSVRRQAFQFITKLTGSSPNNRVPDFLHGVPARALLLTCAISLLAFMNVKYGSQQTLYLLSSVNTSSCFGTWFAMNLTYLRFHRGLVRRGRRPNDGRFHYLRPCLAIWGLFWSFIFIVMNGYPLMAGNLDNKSAGKAFVVAYFSPILFVVLYIGYKFKNWIPYFGTRFGLRGTAIVDYVDMDLDKIAIQDNSVPEKWWQIAIAWVL